MRRWRIWLLAVLCILWLTACAQEEGTDNGQTTETNVQTEMTEEREGEAVAPDTEETGASEAAADTAVERTSVAFLEEMERPLETLPYESTDITPDVPVYEIADDLSNIENLAAFGAFTDEQRAHLVENGFVVCKKDSRNGELGYDQIFHIYDQNEYLGIPGFVTGDSMTHLFHIFYDSFLRNTERDAIYPKLVSMTEKLLDRNLALYEEIHDTQTKNVQLRNIAFFATAARLLAVDHGEIPPEALVLVEQEIANIESKNLTESATTLFETDFSQMTPRGHYTRDDVLERYFLATMYYGQAGIYPLSNGYPEPDAMVQALLMTHSAYGDEDVFRLWSDAVDPIDFLVEGAEDLSLREMGRALYGVYGQEPDLDALYDDARLAAVAEELEKHPLPQINPGKGLSFRFIPQRAVLDNVLMQNLVDLAEPGRPSLRPIYNGLDIMASFGSETAKEWQLAEPYNQIWPEYPDRLQGNMEKVEKMEEAEWQTNLYRGWLWMLTEYANTYGEGYPFFMQNEAWQRKDLRSALGSWAELKHDTVLYGKQVGAQKGGGMPMDPPVSYVEPNLPLFEKLSWLLRYTKVQLGQRDMLGTQEEKLNGFHDMVDFCVAMIKKQLQNEPFTNEEKDRLLHIGGEMESVSTKFVETDTAGGISYWWEIESETDRRMPIVADLMRMVENSCDIPPGQYLHVATGAPDEIYVVYPHDGQLYMGRAVYSAITSF